jgi:hypothetical protein
VNGKEKSAFISPIASIEPFRIALPMVAYGPVVENNKPMRIALRSLTSLPINKKAHRLSPWASSPFPSLTY